MITTLFSIQFIVIAIFINMIVFFITNSVKDFSTKGRGSNPDFGLPNIAIRNILMVVIFILAFGSTWALATLGEVVLISKSIFLTSSWCAVLSTITYNIGVKEIMQGLRLVLKKKILLGGTSTSNKSINKKVNISKSKKLESEKNIKDFD